MPWLPDETLFSYCSRFHRLSLQWRAEATSLTLFGRGRSGRAHDLPDGIDGLIERTGGQLGDASEVIRRHTVLSFYLPFLEPELAESAISAMRGTGIGSLKSKLGLMSSRFGASHPLKACPECMTEDVEHHHVAYWHLSHQLPGVWICSRHRRWLTASSCKSTGVQRFQWLLPDVAAMTQIIPSSTAVDDRLLEERLLALAEAVSAIARTPEGQRIEVELTVAAHRQVLLTKKWVEPNGRAKLDRVGYDLSAFMAPLQRVPELACLAVPAAQASGLLVYLRDTRRAKTHPLRRIALSLWLHGSWTGFDKVYGCAPPISARCAPAPSATKPKLDDPRRGAFLGKLLDSEASLSRSALEAGIDTQTGMAWAAQAGISVQRRPKQLTQELRRRLVSALRAGRSKASVAKSIGVSVQTVTNTLRTEIGLQEAWHRARFEIRRRTARASWLRLAIRYPMVGVKMLRLLEPAGYAWLYRNDRSWLVEQQAQLTPRSKGNHSQVSWDQRDLVLSSAVARVCSSLAIEMPERRIQLWRIYQRLPELKTKLRRLDQLPLTRAAIELALAYRPTGSPKLI